MSGCDELFPFAFYEYLNADTMKQKAGYFVLSAGMFFCELSAKSSVPFYLVLAELVILMVMHGRQGTRLIKKGTVWIGMAVVLLLGLNLAVKKTYCKIYVIFIFSIDFL